MLPITLALLPDASRFSRNSSHSAADKAKTAHLKSVEAILNQLCAIGLQPAISFYRALKGRKRVYLGSASTSFIRGAKFLPFSSHGILNRNWLLSLLIPLNRIVKLDAIAGP